MLPKKLGSTHAYVHAAMQLAIEIVVVVVKIGKVLHVYKDLGAVPYIVVVPRAFAQLLSNF